MFNTGIVIVINNFNLWITRILKVILFFRVDVIATCVPVPSADLTKLQTASIYHQVPPIDHLSAAEWWIFLHNDTASLQFLNFNLSSFQTNLSTNPRKKFIVCQNNQTI